MKISVELFLLDNTLMNLCVYLLAAVWIGTRARPLPILLASLIGAVYALLSLFVVPALRLLPVKLVCFLLFGLPLWERGTSLIKTLLCILLAAAAVGGVALSLTLLCGGSVLSNGTLIGTLPLRTALIIVCASLALLRAFRGIVSRRELTSRTVPMTVTMGGTERTFRALVDTGNALIEPVSGLPIALLSGVTVETGRPVVYRTQGGASILLAARPEQITVQGRTVCGCVAKAVMPIPGADAILPASMLPKEWRNPNESMDPEPVAAPDASASLRPQERLLVYPQRRNPARAARPRGGSAVHRGGADGEVGQG